MKSRTLQPPEFRHLKDLFFILFSIAILFYILALMSYNPRDPFLNSASFPPLPVTNIIGSLGASISAFVLYTFGIGAFLLPVPGILAVIGNFSLRLTRYTFFVFFISPLIVYVCVAYFFFKYLATVEISGFSISTVGQLGLWLNEKIYSHLGPVGAPVLSLVLGALGTAMLFQYDRIYIWIRKFRARLKIKSPFL